MKPLLLLLFVSAQAHASTCTWDKPGVDPFQGNIANAVDHYADIPPSIRMVLKEKIRTGNLDDVVEIRRDSISHGYGAEITDMHFGRNKICRTVTRAGWSDTHVEKAKVFCAEGYCVIVPRICNNLSRVSRIPVQEHDNGGTGGYSILPGPVYTTSLEVLPSITQTQEYDYPAFPIVPTVSFNGCCFKPPVSAVPEAHEWLMMLVGLVLILWRHHGARTSAN